MKAAIQFRTAGGIANAKLAQKAGYGHESN